MTVLSSLPEFALSSREFAVNDQAAGEWPWAMGCNGPTLPLCQDLCVESWRAGSKLLPCLGKEMSVLTHVLTRPDLCLGKEMSVLTHVLTPCKPSCCHVWGNK